MAEEFKRHEWQHELETNPTQSLTNIISLYDLIFDKDGETYTSKAASSKDVGARLEHDIICYDAETYDETAGLPFTQYGLSDSTCSWRTRGIDIAIPRYDLRANHKFIQSDYTITNFLSYDNNDRIIDVQRKLFSQKKILNEGEEAKNGYYLFDKDAVVQYNTIDEFTQAGIQIDDTNALLSWNSYTAPSICPIDDVSDHSDDPCDIILANEDLAFKGNLVTRSSLRAFNRIFLNTNSSYFGKLIAKALGFNPWVIDPEGVCNYRNTEEEGPFGLNFRNKILELCKEDWFIETLKNTYVLVRAAFFADYIKTASFGQDLNKDSQVQHSELMLSTGNADFNKYDDIFISNQLLTSGMFDQTGKAENIDESKLSESTEVYIPKVNPTVDFLTSNFVRQNVGDITEDGNFSPKLPAGKEDTLDEYLDDKINSPNPTFKGLPIASINRRDANKDIDKDKTQNYVPENYFDGESRKTAKDYYENGRMPTVLPPKGNAYVEGRIIGPTIDELWYMLDKMVSGRPADIRENGKIHRYSDTDVLDIGLPVGSGDRVNDKDSSMTEVRDSEFNFKYLNKENKIGTPLGHEYIIDTSDMFQHPETKKWFLDENFTREASEADFKNRRKVQISKFINQNDEIIYPVYEALEQLANEILYLRNVDNVDEEIRTERQMDNFTAWDYPTTVSNEEEEPQEDGTFERRKKVDNGQKVKYSDNTNWGPRPAPYSLRELEAMIKAQKFNFETFARFIKETFGITGRYGKVVEPTETDKSNVAAGSLYQFHKDFNFNQKYPNTWFSRDGRFDTKSGTPAIFDDKDSRVQGAPKNFKNHADYGTAENLRELQSEYGADDVYLAADGTWRYVFDHVRVPILKCEY